jgi:phenylpropionate dioxygenase-like ring-hydroxylating dioxygenase large terminal subunit
MSVARENHTLPWPDVGYSLPAEFYTSQVVYELEKAEVFGKDWFFVAPEADVPRPGDYASFVIAGEPLLLTRAQDNQVRVLSRVCRHRAMLITNGRGTSSTFSCPYHSWTYRADGRLIGAPFMENHPSFVKEKCGLPSLPVTTWNGLVFASLVDTPPPIEESLRKLDNRLEQYHLPDWMGELIYDEEIGANWKVVLENATESYHHIGAHRKTLEVVTPGKNVRMGDSGERFATHHNWPKTLNPDEPLEGFTRVGDLTLSKFEALVGGITTVFPNLIMAVGEKGGLFAGVFPIDANRTTFKLWTMQHRSMETQRYEARSGDRDPVEFIFDFNDEDLFIAAGVARGLRSRFASSGPLSHLESGLTRFYAFLRSRIEHTAGSES